MTNIKFAWNAEFEDSATHLTEFFVNLGIALNPSAFDQAKNKESEIGARPDQENSEEFNRYQKSVRMWTIEVSRAIHASKKARQQNTPHEKFSPLKIENFGHTYQLSDVVVRFTRYEGKRIVILVFDYLCAPFSMDEKWLGEAQGILNRELENRFQNTLRSNFQVKTKFDQSAEFHRVLNPVPIFFGNALSRESFDSSYGEIESTIQLHDQPASVLGCLRLTTTTYLSDSDKDYYNANKPNRDELNNYVRLHKTVYLVATSDNTTNPSVGDSFDEDGNFNRSKLLDKIHTEFLFFSRGHHYEKKFETTYKSIQFLDELIRLFNEQWSRVRTAYFISPKFSITNRSDASKNFFHLLEINAQINAMITRIKFEMEGQYNSMIEAFERPLFTIKQQNLRNDQETAYYVDLSDICQKPFLVFNQKRQALEEAFDRISENVKELRSDFDSNTNVMLQSLVFLFSGTMVIWGLVTVILDKLHDVIEDELKETNSSPKSHALDFIYQNFAKDYSFSTLTLGSLIIFAVGFIVIASLWMKYSATSTNKKLTTKVKLWLDEGYKGFYNDQQAGGGSEFSQLAKIVTTALEEHSQIKKSSFFRRINKILELIALILPAVSLNRIDPLEGKSFMREIREHLKTHSEARK